MYSESYYLNDKLHRIDGPAAIFYYDDYKLQYQYYCLNGKLHRTDGPAEIFYCKNGQIQCENYWVEGNKYSKNDYTKLLNDIRQLPEGVRLTDRRKWVRNFK